MKRKNVFLVITAAVIVLLIKQNCLGKTQSAAAQWRAQFRPGIAMGDGNNETNFFSEFFIPFWSNSKSLLFLNPYLVLDDKNSNEESIGIGYRRLLFKDRLILGVNGFYDTMRSRRDFRYDQVGIGLEALSKWLDIRFNDYIPLNDRTNRLDSLDRYEFGSKAIVFRKGWEEALKGFDAEIGVMIPIISDYIETRAYVGGYWYDSEVRDDIEGKRYRLEVKPCRLINLDLEIKNDHIQGNDTYIGGYLSIPFSLSKPGLNIFEKIKEELRFGKGYRKLPERMTEKVIRHRHILTHSYRGKHAKEIVEVIYVSSDNPNHGKGTYKDPYKDINWVMADPRYKPGTWIYVFSMDDKPDTLHSNLQLLPKSVLWGEGYRHPVFELGGGPTPTLSGYATEPTEDMLGLIYYLQPNRGVVNLSDQNEVMGFIIQNGPVGVYGKDINGAYVHDNNITQNKMAGIYIKNGFNDQTGYARKLMYSFSDNEISNNGVYGIYLDTDIESSGDIKDLEIANRFYDNSISHSQYGIFLSNTVSSNSKKIDNVQVKNIVENNNIEYCTETGISASNDIRSAKDFLYSSNSYFYYVLHPPQLTSGDIHNAKISSHITNNSIVNNGAGVYWNDHIRSYVHIHPYPWFLFSAPMASGDIADSHIHRYFTGNNINNNTVNGVTVMSDISSEVRSYLWGRKFILKSGNLSNVEVYTSFNGNVISGNANKGILVDNSFFGNKLENAFEHLVLEKNRIVQNASYGLEVDYPNNSSLITDLGGGPLGSAGENRFYSNNSECDILLYGKGMDTSNVTYENNIWSATGATSPSEGQIKFLAPPKYPYPFPILP
jgi:hypothetical protein